MISSDSLLVATSTRQMPMNAEPLTPGGLRQFVERMKFPAKAAVGMQQVHGNSVQRVGGDDDQVVPNCDGLITRERQVLLAVRSADCLPIVVHDPQRGVLGVAHAGWRGLKSGVIERLADAMAAEGSSPADWQVSIGPAIGVCCYAVGPEFATLFPGRLQERDGQRFLDLKQEAGMILNRLGVNAGQVVVSDLCTACDRENCYSYRREGAAAGRMLTCAMMM